MAPDESNDENLRQPVFFLNPIPYAAPVFNESARLPSGHDPVPVTFTVPEIVGSAPRVA
jgi:hypothetical protein